MRIIQHLVKLEHSPAIDPRNGWRRAIKLARLQAQKRLEEHGETDELEANVLRRARYTEEQVLGDWFPQEPAR